MTYFESPNFPHASQKNLGSCTLTVLLARNVKQVLVDFLFFELLPPSEGNCVDDKLIVTGQNINADIPVICGIASGQHSKTNITQNNRGLKFFDLSTVFIDVDGSDKIQLNIITQTADDRAFSIRVTQLRDNLAPQGCLQYHKTSEGIIKTFNYDDNSQIQYFRKPSYFVSNCHIH